MVITPQHTVRQVLEMSEQLGISGFPVVDQGKVVGIVSGRDLRFETRYELPIHQIMTPKEKLVTVPEGTTLPEAKALLNKYKLERLLVVNDAFELKGLITVKDITKQTSFPNAARDGQGQALLRPGHRPARSLAPTHRAIGLPARSLRRIRTFHPRGRVGLARHLGSLSRHHRRQI